MRRSLVALVAALSLCPVVAAAKPAPFRLLSVSSGEVTSAGKTVPVGSELTPGVAVAVGAGASAVLQAGDFGRLLIHGPAAFTPRSRGADGLDLTEGGVLAVLKGLRGRRFSIGTRTALAAVRGTEFFVEDRGERTYLCVCDGRVEVRARKGGFHAAVSTKRKHAPFLFDFSGPAATQAPAPMEGHHDDELRRLETGFAGRR